MQKIIPPFLLLMLPLFTMAQQDDQAIILTVTNLRNNNGHVLISLFNNEKGFPEKSEKSYSKKKIVIQDKKAIVTFTAVPRGTYAIAILHDENDDMKMNTNFIGLPKEGYGFSNNVMGTFGPPSFTKAGVQHKGDQVTNVVIKTKY